MLKEEKTLLENNLESRKVIDRAKGMLTDKYGLKESDAYRYIQKKAMTERTTMKDIAETILTEAVLLTVDSQIEDR